VSADSPTPEYEYRVSYLDTLTGERRNYHVGDEAHAREQTSRMNSMNPAGQYRAERLRIVHWEVFCG
jgi:hypothetical protein